MPNKHIKTINGRKYYYESIRKGDKVTSRYLGPVGRRVRKTITEEPEEPDIDSVTRPEDLVLPDDSYIG